MALTQYNNWEPTLDAVSGTMAREPRVFSHDAFAIVQGAINYSHSNFGLEIVSGGSGYTANATFKSQPTSGSAAGTGLSIDATADDNGVVTSISLYPDELSPNYNSFNNAGQGYAVGETLVMSGVGTGFQLKVVNIDIPNTQKRGCCIYIGASAGIPSLSVTMESGRDVVFETLSAGSILPILVKRVNTAITGNDVIALF